MARPSVARIVYAHLIRRAAMISWNAEDLLMVEAVPAALRKAYPASNIRRRETVMALEPGGSSGPGVHPVVLGGGQETNVYGWQVVTKIRQAAEAMAPSAEGFFFNNPEKREVREFAQAGAISNDPAIAADAAVEDNLDESPAQAAREAEAAPPTPTEIEDEPGGDQLSTLNRFVVETQETVPTAVPQSHAEVPKHPVIVGRVVARYLGSLETP